MTTVLLIIHLFVTLTLIGVVLLQRSEGGGLGVGTSQGMGSFMSGRGTANLLTRTTAILAALFFGLSLALALLNKGTTVRHSILDVSPPAGSPAPSLPAPPGSPIPGSPVPGSPIPGTPAPTPAPVAPAPKTPAPEAVVPPAPVAPAPIAPAPVAPAPAAPASGAPSVPTN